MRLALYQPDIPQNAGTILRLGAATGLPVDIIEPCGFVFDDRRMRRAGMDYIGLADFVRHPSWDEFAETLRDGAARLVLFTTSGDRPYTDFAYEPEDVLLFGRESAGVPDAVHARADARLVIPMKSGARSLNVALAAAMAAGEALRQTRYRRQAEA